ncbi:MAG: M1 family aminopeptidase [Flavipsychrobacter sp.]|nr:M1 family aminopeptidase [Flavipsychrobacter sp.]
MFSSIFNFEVRRWLKSPAFYIYFFVLLIITFLLGIAAGGAFNGVHVVFGGEKVWVNSPSVIDVLLTYLNKYVAIILIVAIIGNTVLKDFTDNTYSLIFTTPVSKFSYLFGRYSASLFITLIILSASIWGLMIGYATPWVDADKIGPFVLAPYWATFWQTIIPNTIFIGAIFFAVSLMARDIFMIWLFLIILFVVMGVSDSYLQNLAYEKIATLVDPFGANAKEYLTKYWSIYEKNHSLIPLKGLFLVNRVIWLSVSFGIMALGASFFSFSAAPRVVLFKRRRLVDVAVNTPMLQRLNLSEALPGVHRSFTTGSYLSSLWSLSVNECKTILRNVYFRIILLFGMLLLLLVSSQIGNLFETSTFPVTYMVIQYFANTLQIFIVILTILFSGELVWRARIFRMSNILDAQPVPNWVYYLSKLFALWFMQAILLSIIVFCGFIVQTYKGYYHYEFGLYIKYLFGFRLINLWLLAVVAILIQTLVGNRYVGFFIAVLFYIWNYSFAALVLKNHLFVYGSDSGYVYSDMNGFGHAIAPFFIYKLYWSIMAVCIAVFSALMWARGAEGTFKSRFADARVKASRSSWIVIVVGLCIFITCGSFIYYNTNIENKFKSPYVQNEVKAEYERKYRKFLNVPQPKITAVKLNLDIYPQERRLECNGNFVIKNKTMLPIDSIMFSMPEKVKLNSVSFGVPSTQVVGDNECCFYIYRLAKTLLPGDSISMQISTSVHPKGFEHDFTTLSTPLYNGTFMNNTQYLPTIGYSLYGEIEENSERKKHKLGYRRTANPITDVAALQNNVFFQDADFVNFEATVSTVPDQIAIAPGYLQKEWLKDGRRYFQYKMDSKILDFYSVMSARYEVKREKWNGVNIEIYYQKGHEYNVDDMIHSIKKSLDYYSTQYSPYQHKQVRILEFPRYSSFAQSFPNTIPFSEGIGFIANVKDTSVGSGVDYVFEVTAHEVAHQWFAHQVIGADVEGSNMMSESLAQYASIKVVEKEFGIEKVKKTLKYELNNYLLSRSLEKEKEKPLALVDAGQQYILYRKGRIIWYGLSRYIGEDSMNHTLKRFLNQHAFQGAPYPTTLDLIAEVRRSTPDSLQYLITDGFERIVLYDNKITTATATLQTGKGYNVDFTINCKKLLADSVGREKPITCNDYFEVGILDAKGKLLKKEIYRLKNGDTTLHWEVSTKPGSVVIDPDRLLIDKDPEDNSYKLKF